MKRMRRYEEYKEQKWKSTAITIYALGGGFVALILFILWGDDELPEFGFPLFGLLSAIYILGAWLGYKRLKEAYVALEVDGVKCKGAFLEYIIPYERIRQTLENRRIEIHQNGIYVPAGYGIKLHFYFDVGGKAGQREAYRGCYKELGKRIGMELPVVKESDVTVLDKKYFYTRKLKYGFISLTCFQVFGSILFLAEGPTLKGLGVGMFIGSIISVVSFMNNFWRLRECNVDIKSALFDKYPTLKNCLGISCYVYLIAFIGLIVVGSLPLLALPS